MTVTDFSGNEGLSSTVLNTVGIFEGFIPKTYALTQNWPNPFRSSTTIQLDLPEDESVLIEIFDINGRLVKTLASGDLPAGRHHLSWTGQDDAGRDVSPGIYFYRIESETFTRTRKAIRVQ